MWQDDAAVNNVQFSCDGNDRIGSWYYSKSTEWGSWDNWRYCGLNEAVCGIQTRVEPYQGKYSADDVSLTEVALYCCQL